MSVEVGNMLKQLGFEISWEIATAKMQRLIASEVYPHAALIRFFSLKERLRYKKGPVGQRRKLFSRLQKMVCTSLKSDLFDVKYVGFDPRTKKQKVSRRLLLERPPKKDK